MSSAPRTGDSAVKPTVLRRAGRPLLLSTLMFTCGILIAAAGTGVMALITALLAAAISILVFLRRARALPALLLALFCALGAFRFLTARRSSIDAASPLAPGVVTLTGVVQSDAREHPQSGTSRYAAVECLIAVQDIEMAGRTARSVRVSSVVSARLPLISGHFNELPCYGDAIFARGRLEPPDGRRNPGGSDAAALLARKGVSALLFARRPEDWRLLRAHTTLSPQSWAFRLRHVVIDHVRAALTPEHAAVLDGLLLGDRDDLSSDLNETFERIGAAHLLATAGLHVGLVVGLLLAAVRRIRLPRRVALLLTIGLLALYAVMAGGRPSVVRAVIVADVFLLGILLEREPDLPNALALSALLLLWTDPTSLFDAGFQLSFATVITIVLLMPLTEPTLRRIGELLPRGRPGAIWLRRGLQLPVTCLFLAVTAQIGAAPLVAYHDHELSLIAPIANTLLVPPVGLLIALGFTAVSAGALYYPLSWPLDHLLDALLTPFVALARLCAAPTWATVSIAPPPIPFLIAYYAAVWTLAWFWRLRLESAVAPRSSGTNSSVQEAEWSDR